jgi:hypothetical protein
MSEQCSDKMALVGFYVAERLKAAIDRAAQAEMISRSDYCRRAVARDLQLVDGVRRKAQDS